MRELTFNGFLKQYVRSLSLAKTSGLYKLAAEAVSDNPRLREPLFLYAFFSGKEKVLLTAVKSQELYEKYTNMLKRYDRQSLERALVDSDTSLPDEYTKVYRSYLAVKNRRKSDEHTKALMRDRIIRLQREKGISNYRLYTGLRINHGNMNAYIKHGDCSKVSLATARSAVAYMEQA